LCLEPKTLIFPFLTKNMLHFCTGIRVQ